MGREEIVEYTANMTVIFPGRQQKLGLRLNTMNTHVRRAKRTYPSVHFH